jgi:hypothetical protein
MFYPDERNNNGQLVEALTSAQGLKRSEVYCVTDVQVQSLTFGDFVTYTVVDKAGKALQISNGHLLLRLVPVA